MRVPLDLPVGLVGDDTSFAASPRWRDGSNVRFRLGRPQVIGGWESLVGDLLTGVCRSVLPWTDHEPALNIGFGTHSNLAVWVGGALYDITPSSGFTAGAEHGTGGAGYGSGAYSVGNYSEPATADYYPLTWSLSTWGANLIANPRGQTIFAWTNNTASKAAAISGAPANVSYALVAPQQRQIFALGCNEEVSTTFNPMCIRHCSIGDNTDWTTATDSTAREYILPGGGRIVAGRNLGNYIVVWTDNAVFLGSYVGSIEQPWRFDKVGDGCGLVGPNAAVVDGLTAFWIGQDLNFYSYTLGGVANAVDCPIRHELVEHLAVSQFDKIAASAVSQFNEIRFDYPDDRDGIENSRYFALCTNGQDAGAWYKGQMARSAFSDSGPAVSPIGVSPDGQAYWHERLHTADGGPFSWFIESSDQYFDPNSTVLVRGCWPDIQDQIGPVNLTLTTRFKPQSDEYVYGPYAMSVSEDRVDFKARGRLFKVKFSGSAAPTDFRLGKPVFDVVPAGLR